MEAYQTRIDGISNIMNSLEDNTENTGSISNLDLDENQISLKSKNNFNDIVNVELKNTNLKIKESYDKSIKNKIKKDESNRKSTCIRFNEIIEIDDGTFKNIEKSECVESTNTELTDINKILDDYTWHYFKTLKTNLPDMLDATVNTICKRITRLWKTNKITHLMQDCISTDIKDMLLLWLQSFNKDEINQLYEDLIHDGNTRKLGDIHFKKIKDHFDEEKRIIVNGLLDSLIRFISKYRLQSTHSDLENNNIEQKYNSSMEKNLLLSIRESLVKYSDYIFNVVKINQADDEIQLASIIQQHYLIPFQLSENYRITVQMYNDMKNNNQQQTFTVISKFQNRLIINVIFI